MDILFWAEFWVKLAFAVFMFVLGVVFIRKGLEEKEMKSQRYFKYGLAMFALMTGLTRLFFLGSDFQVPDSDIYNILWKCAALSSMIALVFITILIETYLVKTRYICTIVGIIGTIALLIVDIPTGRTLNIPLYIVLGGEILALYLYLIIKSPGELRTRSMYMLLGIIIFTVGLFLDSEFMMGILGFDSGIIAAILMWIGLGYYLKLNY